MRLRLRGFWKQNLWRPVMVSPELKWIPSNGESMKVLSPDVLSLHCGLKSAIVEWWNLS